MTYFLPLLKTICVPQFPHHANFVFNMLGKKDDLEDIYRKCERTTAGHEEYGLVDQEAMLKTCA